MSFGKLQEGCHVPFTEEWLPPGHTTIKAWSVECCRDGCSSGRFSHLHWGTLELCQSDQQFLGYLPDQGPSPPIAQFGRAASSRKRLGWSKHVPFKNDGGHCVLGDLQYSRNVLVPLVFDLTYTVNCGTLYTQVCAFPNHVQSIEFSTGGLKSSCRNISRMINGNRMHLSSISSLKSKGSE